MVDNPSWMAELERSQIARTALRAVISVSVLLAIYCLAPVPQRPHETTTPHVGVALVVFVLVLAFEVSEPQNAATCLSTEPC